MPTFRKTTHLNRLKGQFLPKWSSLCNQRYNSDFRETVWIWDWNPMFHLTSLIYWGPWDWLRMSLKSKFILCPRILCFSSCDGSNKFVVKWCELQKLDFLFDSRLREEVLWWFAWSRFKFNLTTVFVRRFALNLKGPLRRLKWMLRVQRERIVLVLQGFLLRQRSELRKKSFQ